MGMDLQERFEKYVNGKKGFSLTESEVHKYPMIIYFKDGQYSLRRLMGEQDKEEIIKNLDESSYLLFWSEKPNRGATFAGFDRRAVRED